MYSTTLCFVIDGNPITHVLLGMKKRGFGWGKYNGFGGKVEAGETTKAAAVRELREECGLIAREEDLIGAGTLDFLFSHASHLDHNVHIFLVRQVEGELVETEEMKPVWVPVLQIPYEEMWKDDQSWLPQIVAGKKVQGQVYFAQNQEDIDNMVLSFEDREDVI